MQDPKAEYNDWLEDEGAGDAKPLTDEELEDLEDDEPFQGDNQHDLVRDYQ